MAPSLQGFCRRCLCFHVHQLSGDHHRASSSSLEWLELPWFDHNLLVGLHHLSEDYPRLVLYCSLCRSGHTGVHPQSASLRAERWITCFMLICGDVNFLKIYKMNRLTAKWHSNLFSSEKQKIPTNICWAKMVCHIWVWTVKQLVVWFDLDSSQVSFGICFPKAKCKFRLL